MGKCKWFLSVNSYLKSSVKFNDEKRYFYFKNANILTLWVLIVAEIPRLILKLNLWTIKCKDSQIFVCYESSDELVKNAV